MNALTKIMKTKIEAVDSSLNSKKPTISSGVKGASNWLRKHKQTDNGKKFEKK